MGLPAPATHNASDARSSESAVSSSFIMKVQHLIERCLTFYLDREECVKALSRHAGIDPIITRTVWKELEKANQDFFERYHTDMATKKQYSHANEESDDEENNSTITTFNASSPQSLDTCNQLNTRSQQP